MAQYDVPVLDPSEEERQREILAREIAAELADRYRVYRVARVVFDRKAKAG